MKKVVVAKQGSKYDVKDFYEALYEFLGESCVDSIVSKSLEIGEHMIYKNLNKRAESKGFKIKWIARHQSNRVVYDVFSPHGNTAYTVIGFIITDEELDADWLNLVKEELQAITPEQQTKAFWEFI